MRNVPARAMTLVLLAFLLGACGSGRSGLAADSKAAARTVASGSAAKPRPCQLGALVLGPGMSISPMTGEHAVEYRIRNGGAACALDGYPAVALFDGSGKRLAFRYTDGHSQYLTSARPRTVILPHGGSAYVEIAKYRCDLGDVAAAATVRLTVPGSRHLVLTGPVAPAGSYVASLSYCQGGGNDPGQIVGVSPVELSENATGPFGG